MPQFIKNYITGIHSQTQNFDINKLISDGLNFYKKIKNDDTVYKDIRRYIIENQKQLFTKIPEELKNCDLDELFSKSLLKTTFMEYIDKNITIELSDSVEKKYYQFIIAYSALNVLGLDLEKNKKLKFDNMTTDSISYLLCRFM